MITGLSTETFKNLQLNAGAFLADFEYSDIADADALKAALAEAIKDESKCLGATRGGGTFECTPEKRNIEADGKRYEFVGSTVFDSWTVRMTGTLLEVKPSNWKRVLAAADVTGEKGKQVIRVRTDLLPTDYIKKLVWVGDTSEGFILIALKNALNTSGATMTFTDKGEGTLPFEFHAHQDSVDDMSHAPFEIVHLEKTAEAIDGVLKETVAQVRDEEAEASGKTSKK